MAKRKRLTPMPSIAELAPTAVGGPARAPIAQVAGDAAAAAALHDLAEEITRAREEGRLLLSLPLDAILSDHLVRDRIASDAEEMTALTESLRARGQQTPIEVEVLSEGRYGLISGWRRLAALRRLWEETGEARFASVQAILRRPDTGAAAYVAMVEENEVRADLSFYERARIVRQAVRAGAFDSEGAALGALFASAPAARRSKIKSFLRIVEELDGVLRHPVRLSEHLGLKLSKALAADPGLAGRIGAVLQELDPADPDAEIARLQRLADKASKPAARGRAGTARDDAAASGFRPVARGISMRHDDQGLVLRGAGVTPDLAARIAQFLRDPK